jgi:hypothetical protein
MCLVLRILLVLINDYIQWKSKFLYYKTSKHATRQIYLSA